MPRGWGGIRVRTLNLRRRGPHRNGRPARPETVGLFYAIITLLW